MSRVAPARSTRVGALDSMRMGVQRSKSCVAARTSGVAPCHGLGTMNHRRAGLAGGLGRIGFEAVAGASFVRAARADHDEFVAFYQALGVHGRVAAANTDGEQFGDFFRDGEKAGHGFEGRTPVIGVQSGDDHTFAEIGKLRADIHNFFPQELRFVDANDFGAWLKLLHDFGSLGDVVRGDAQAGMGDNFVGGVTRVDGGLEYLHALAGDSSAAKPADEFLALARKHWADHDFNPTHVALHDVHALSPYSASRWREADFPVRAMQSAHYQLTALFYYVKRRQRGPVYTFARCKTARKPPAPPGEMPPAGRSCWQTRRPKRLAHREFRLRLRNDRWQRKVQCLFP